MNFWHYQQPYGLLQLISIIIVVLYIIYLTYKYIDFEEKVGSYIHFFNSRLLGYEGVEVINPDGGKEDAEEEAQKGRWKQEVLILYYYLLIYL